MRYSAIVGIDAHSKKNAACAIVPATGEMRETILSEDPEQLLACIVMHAAMFYARMWLSRPLFVFGDHRLIIG